MRDPLSSANTFFWKFVFPVVWIGAFVTGTAALFLTDIDVRHEAGQVPPQDMKWMFLIATVVGSVLIYWGGVRLKRIAIDDHALYISNYLKEIVVPLQELERVSENRVINTHPVTLSFRRETEFGRRVVFIPKARFFGFLSSHPVVDQLRTAAARAQQVGG